jgi:hypothetical protein
LPHLGQVYIIIGGRFYSFAKLVIYVHFTIDIAKTVPQTPVVPFSWIHIWPFGYFLLLLEAYSSSFYYLMKLAGG